MAIAKSSVRAAREGERFHYLGLEWTVGPKCSAKPGRWLCITHPNDRALAQYRNQLQKDIHISAGRHVLAWVCAEHGPEAP